MPLNIADRTHFGNIVSNLIDNAIKYSPGEARVEIKCRTENGWFILSVRDQGIGIPHDKQRHVFDKFYRGAVLREDHDRETRRNGGSEERTGTRKRIYD